MDLAAISSCRPTRTSTSLLLLFGLSLLVQLLLCLSKSAVQFLAFSPLVEPKGTLSCCCSDFISTAVAAVCMFQEILERAYDLTTVRGSSTACVAVLNGDQLAVSNLGDSGLLILRAGEGFLGGG